MQSSLYFASIPPPYFPFPWKSHKIQYLTPSHKPIKPSLKLLTLSNSSKTSFDFEFQEKKLDKPEEPTSPVPLPLVIRRSGSVSRYIWDGNELKFVSLDENSVSLWSFFSGNGFQKLFSICSLGVRNFFLPREVTRNYLEYVKWKFLHRVFSSALQVLATQAMFRAIGVGYTRALPSAAALNWVLKDGLGRLSRCVFTASLASAFDTNLKRVRFSTSVLFSLSIGVELLTPAFPKYFLLLATIANVAKQISLACYLATGTAVHRSFAVADNLGEVSAKAQIQTVCFDNLGLMLAAALNIIFRNNQRLQAGLPFVVYPIFSAFDLIGIYHGLKHVHLQTLTKQILSSPTPPTVSFYYRGLWGSFWSSLEKEPLEDRLEIVINKWIQLGCVPSPADVSKEEGIDFMRSNGRGLWPIRIGSLNAKSQIPRLSMMTMRSLKDEDIYFVCLENLCSGFTATSNQGIVLCMREGAGTSDVIMGLLQACHIRKAILSRSCRWEDNLEACYDSDSAVRHWFKLVEDCKQCAQRDFNLINQHMLGVGWACKNILLSTQEQARYGFVHERENCTDTTGEKFF